jgi:hypothetical protein
MSVLVEIKTDEPARLQCTGWVNAELKDSADGFIGSRRRYGWGAWCRGRYPYIGAEQEQYKEAQE